MIFGGKLLSENGCVFAASNLLFSQVHTVFYRQRQAVVMLKIHNNGLDRLGATGV